jgi:predicted nucleotidyltransferase
MGQTTGLAPHELRAVMATIERVRREVPAPLRHAILFGSRARGSARPDSDVDLLLVFRRLPPDREPQATRAERVAAEVAAASGVPVGVWSVSLPDFAEGVRTPMLVDAIEDGVRIWSAAGEPPDAPFTPADARFCAGRLLERVDEGGVRVARLLATGDPAWAARVRDDLVRLCTSIVLLAGVTRPRRGETVRAALAALSREGFPAEQRRALAWVARSYPAGHLEPDAQPAPPPPPVPAATLLALADRLRGIAAARLRRSRRAKGFVRR